MCKGSWKERERGGFSRLHAEGATRLSGQQFARINDDERRAVVRSCDRAVVRSYRVTPQKVLFVDVFLSFEIC